MTTSKKTAETSAILEGATANTEALNNRLSAQGEFLPVVTDFGVQAAKGEIGHTAVCFEFQRLCAEGVFDQADSRKVYTAYVAGFNSIASSEEGKTHGVEVMGEASLKTGASILGTFGHPAVAAQGVGLYDRIRTIRGQMKPEERKPGSPTSHFAAVNRAIAGKAAKVVDPKSVTVSDEEIVAWLTVEGKADKGLLEQFKPLADLAMKLAKTNRFDGLAPIAEQLVHMMGEIAAGRGVVSADIAELMKGAPTISQTVQ